MKGEKKTQKTIVKLYRYNISNNKYLFLELCVQKQIVALKVRRLD